MGEPRTDGELAGIFLTLKKCRSPVRTAKWRKYFHRPPPVLEKTFPFTSWLAVEAAAILRRTFSGVERYTLRSTKCW